MIADVPLLVEQYLQTKSLEAVCKDKLHRL